MDKEFENRKLVIALKYGSIAKAMNMWFMGKLHNDKEAIEFFREARKNAMEKLAKIDIDK